MFTESLLIFGNQKNLDLVRSIPVEVLAGAIILFTLGQILRSSALFSLNRSFEKNELFLSFIPVFRLVSYLKTSLNSKQSNPSSNKKITGSLTLIAVTLIYIVSILTILFTSNFSLFITSLVTLFWMDGLSRIVLFNISKEFKTKKSFIWMLPLVGSIAILARKEKDIFISL